MGKYQRITLTVRCQINALLQVGISIPEISKQLGFHKTSIYRELRRNSSRFKYNPAHANHLAHRRYSSCRRAYKVTPEVAGKLRTYIEFGWSPEQISQRLKREKSLIISHECIYQHIYKNTNMRKLLRRPKKRGFSRYSQQSCRAKHGRPIEKRPQIVQRRGRIGDWERDLFYGSNKQQVLVCIDRKSRYIKISKLKSTNSKNVGRITEQLIHQLPRKVYTVTNDNGPEFKGEKINIKTFYCTPRKPQQRGSVENVIGLIRQYISRKTDLNKITEREMQDIENKLNFRPRKCLDYKTPYEVFYAKRVAMAI